MKVTIHSRRKFLKLTGKCAITLTTVNLMRACSGTEKKPNVLFLFTDDQRYDTIHALGNEYIQTPVMDDLVQNGTTFTNGYIMGGTSPAVCAPSRAMLLTGRTLFHVEKQGTWEYNITEKYPTMPETFKKAGYTTFGTGKWHNGRASYSRSFISGGKMMFGGMSDHYKVPVYNFDPDGEYPKEKQYFATEKHSSEMYTDTAINFLQNYKEENPFFMYVSFQAPHDPRDMPKKFKDVYDPEKLPIPENFLPEHPFDNGELKVRDEKLEKWPRTPEAIKQHLADYYAMITHLDFEIGRILKTLKELGHYQNTIIILAGDNGLAVGQHGLLGKQNVYEHSVKVPLIICGPGIPRNERRQAFCYLLDIFPTLCDLCNIVIPVTVEGKSLVPAIYNPEEKIRKILGFAYRDYQRAIRDDRLKLIEYNVNGIRTTQLFDLLNDPYETSNLAGNSEYFNHLNRLREELLNLKNTLDDNSNVFWENFTRQL